MNRRAYVKFGLAVLAAATWLGPRPCLGQNGGAEPLVKAEKKVPKRDPVTAAFAIPYGTVLNEKQRAEYERLKEDKASDLREAIAAVETAATPAEKADLQLEVSALQNEIRAGMQQILAMPYTEEMQARKRLAQEQYYSSGQGGYGGDAAVSGSYGSYYYGPVYGYPWYGLPLVYTWRGPHDRGPGNRVENSVATQKALALAKANGTPVARSTATVAPAKPAPAAKPPAPPAPPAKPQNQPAKHR